MERKMERKREARLSSSRRGSAQRREKDRRGSIDYIHEFAAPYVWKRYATISSLSPTPRPVFGSTRYGTLAPCPAPYVSVARRGDPFPQLKRTYGSSSSHSASRTSRAN